MIPLITPASRFGFQLTFRGLRNRPHHFCSNASLFVTKLPTSVPHPGRGRLRRRPPSGGRSRRPFCYEEQDSASRQRQLPNVSFGAANSDRAEPTAVLARCSVPPEILARPGLACRLPANSPLPETGEEGCPSKCGGRGGGFLLLSLHLKGFVRCHPSGGSGLFRIMFRSCRRGLCAALSGANVVSAGGNRIVNSWCGPTTCQLLSRFAH